ncbi:hypothetical protein QU481_01155 [Crenobacter sp. SG2303]|uniref:Uncharacterized protein n=1 Tax=Crenobacter oryzisoli TaxID=3056844 RepID=A0ABT7XI83_9NEIS|nr:hypothetical protein [Crenobacter sp. SG2303]MDN0073507.1 hypothetical protein [Crenobacter sp. SG2303]
MKIMVTTAGSPKALVAGSSLDAVLLAIVGPYRAGVDIGDFDAVIDHGANALEYQIVKGDS